MVSALLLVFILLRSHFGARTNESALPFAVALQPSSRIAPALNSFALWHSIVLALMIAAYGYPIAQFLFVLPPHSAPPAELTRSAARAQVP